MRERRGQRMNRVWYEGGRAPLWLRLAARLFGAIGVLRGGMYRRGLLHRRRLSVPVVVVGNLTVGGTGKTPLTAALARLLVQQGRKPGIASRGHGRRSKSLRMVRADSTWQQVGDEPLMLHRRAGVPVCVAARRSEAAHALMAIGCDVILCDDGLQHLSLARDLEIAVIDGARGFGNGQLLPAGPLRESVDRLSQVGLLVINGEPCAALAPLARRALRMDLVGDKAMPVTAGGQPRPLSAFAATPVHAIAGIGNPGRFFAQLRAAGLQVIEHAFADHHAFTADDLRLPDGLPVLMTEKDAVKCGAFAEDRHWYVPVEARFAPHDHKRLQAALAALPHKGA